MRIQSVPSRVALTVALPALALLVSQLLYKWLQPSFEPLFIAACALVGWLCGTNYGVAATLLSALVLDYFYLPDSGSRAQFFLFFATTGLILALIRYARNTRAQLAASELRYRSLAELIPFGGWIADGRGNMMRVSESFLKTFGTDMEQCRGLGWTLLLDEADRATVLAEWRQCMRSGYFWDYEYRLKAPSGEQYIVLSRGIPVVGTHGSERTWVGIHLDITERERSAEQRVEQARDIARFNAELEQFAYVSAHDLQEPLRMIASYLQLLSRRYKGRLDADADTFIDYAVEGADRLRTLLQDLLQLQQIGKGNRSQNPVPLGEAVQKACENLSDAIGKANAEITCSELPTVIGDEQSMVQLFGQLLDNAIKYRRDGVQPQVRITEFPTTRRNFCEIHVQDNGIGIAPEYRSRIFDVFQRLHPRKNYPGTGIGLAICKKIVEVHGGHITVESTLGEGSTFCLTLPLNQQPVK